MNSENAIEVLIKDGCTKKEAKRFLENGTVVMDNKDDFIRIYVDGANEHEEPEDRITMKDIKEGKVADYSYIESAGKEYYIVYVN